MNLDRSTTRTIWQGRIPVVVRLAAADQNGIKVPEPYYAMLDRSAYLPLVWRDMIDYFASYVNKVAGDHDFWLDANGVPLRWHYPVGLLFDLYGDAQQLPWSLTAHFRGFPEGRLMRCPNDDAVQNYFMQMLKQADSIKNGSTKKVMSMSKQDQLQLWQSLQSHNHDRFWAINSTMLVGTSSDCRGVPFRIYFSHDGSYVQEIVAPLDETGRDLTLADLLRKAIPEHFDAVREGRATLLLQGISPSLDAPLTWLSDHLSYPDNFMHMTVRMSMMTL